MAGPQGEVSKDMALQAFALTFEALPGVVAPDGPRDDIKSGTPALSWIRQYWSELTAEQRAVAERHMPPQVVPRGGSGRGVGQRHVKRSCDQDRTATRTPRTATADALREADSLIARINGMLPAGNDIPVAAVTICFVDQNVVSTRPDGTTTVLAGLTDGSVDAGTLDCLVRIYPVAHNPPRLKSTLAHELMHCYKYRITGSTALGDLNVPWVDEGLSDWVAYEIGGLAPTMLEWAPYIMRPETSLMNRSYDAFGLFTHLQNLRGDVWSTIPAIIRASVKDGRENGPAAFDAAVATNRDVVLDTIASSWKRDPARGTAINGIGPWDLKGAGLAYGLGFTNSAPVRNDEATVSVVAFPWGNVIQPVSLFADVVMISPTLRGTSHGRFGYGRAGDMTLAEAMTKTFCTRDGGCACDDGAAPITFTQLDSAEAYVSLTAQDRGDLVTVSGMSKDKFCAERPKPCRNVGGTGAGCAPPSACELLSPEQVGAAVGRNVGEPTSHETPPTSQCYYFREDDPSGFNMTLSITADATHESYLEGMAAMRGFGPVTAINGLGEEAFLVTWDEAWVLSPTGRISVAAVVARQGGILVQASLGIAAGPMTAEATALTRAALEALP